MIKLKDLKVFLNTLTDEQLEENVVYNSDDMCMSGEVSKVEIAKENLYLWEEEHPAPLYTEAQLRDLFDATDEEIEELTIEIYAGDIVFQI